MEKEFKRRRWIVRKKYKGWTNREIASHLRINKRTVQRWWKAYKKYGLKGLEVKPRKPHTIHKTPDKIVDEVLKIRKNTGYGPDKISGMLRNKGVQIGHNTAYRIVCKNGLNNPINKPRRVMGKTRFERMHSNSLWQADFKQTDDDNYMITFIDDHSRFVLGSQINETMTTEDALRLLSKCIVKFA
jgi:transposase